MSIKGNSRVAMVVEEGLQGIAWSRDSYEDVVSSTHRVALTLAELRVGILSIPRSPLLRSPPGRHCCAGQSQAVAVWPG